MRKEVIGVFDIGKTNKKLLLFDDSLNMVYQTEEKFPEIRDDDGFECDDIGRIESWMKDTVSRMMHDPAYHIRAVNITTYGASLMYLDGAGKPLTPVYNYLKTMPEGVLDGFYEKYGGMEEFCRKTATPALGMLNSGLQALWLKRKKPEVFKRVRTILHFPQYLGYLFTGKITSEYTSIGCHTAMWDFDRRCYHAWLKDEGIVLPNPEANETACEVSIEGQACKVGIGIHDSSASLVPYFTATRDQFMLLSTGTWCILMNPFNREPLTTEQLRKDSLCYMSIRQQQVKSSRLFMGHIHDVNAEALASRFGVEGGYFRKVKTGDQQIRGFLKKKKGRTFFKDGVPAGYVDKSADLSVFSSFEEAYHHLMDDLVDLCLESLRLIIPADDRTRVIYISGGFARNELYTRMLATRFPDKKIYTSEMDNATALGAAMVMWESAFGTQMPPVNLGLKVCHAFSKF